MASKKGIRASILELEDSFYYKHEILDEEDIMLHDGCSFDIEFWIGNEVAELVTQQEDNGNYVSYLVNSQGMVTLHNWGKY